MTAKVDTTEILKMFEDQLKAQRELSDKIMKEEQNLHKSEIERIKKKYEEELKRKL